jgi:hypothetical protein
MTGQTVPARQDVPLRACCGKLRWALLEAIESLPAGAHIGALRWGPAEIPLDLRVGHVPAGDTVAALLDAAERSLGQAASCYAGRGALVIDEASEAREAREVSEEKRGIGDGVP